MISLLRLAKAHSIRFTKAHRPIVIFGLRRGGSTMVSDAIALGRGVWFSNEPYAVLPKHPAFELKKRLLPPARHSQYFALTGQAMDDFASYSHRLINAELAQIGTCWRPKPVLRADRVCLKILNATWMLDWYRQNTDAQILSLIRHPAAQALSVMRQGWGNPVEAYAERYDALEAVFSPSQIDLLRRIPKENDPWKTAILDWIITSHPLRHADAAGTVQTTYEDIVSDPDAFVDQVLIGTFGLKDRAEMLTSFRRPSHSSRMSEASLEVAVAERDIEQMVHGWRAKVDDRMRADGQHLLDVFEVTEYSF